MFKILWSFETQKSSPAVISPFQREGDTYRLWEHVGHFFPSFLAGETVYPAFPGSHPGMNHHRQTAPGETWLRGPQRRRGAVCRSGQGTGSPHRDRESGGE